MHNRRGFIRQTVFAGGALLAAPMINRGQFSLFGRRDYSRRTVDLVQESLVIDMLGLLTLDWPKLARWKRDPLSCGPEELSKLRDSGINVFHPAVDLNTDAPHASALQWLRRWNVFLDSHPGQLARVDRASDFARVKAGGMVGVLLGLQNADHFRIVDDVSAFHRIGQRVSLLTYNSANRIGSGCMAPRDTGLTAFGSEVVAAMDQVGMAVDVSHSGDTTSMDAIECCKHPVIVSHSNCRALVPRHPRCKPDLVIRKLASRGGVIGLTSIRSFVRNGEPTSIEDMLDHFDHVVQLVGVEHVGVGSDTDLDGRDRPGTRPRMDINGLNHPRRIYDLTEGLVARGYSDRSIRLFLGGNFHRVLSEIWAA